MEAEKDKGIIYYIVWYSGDRVHAIDKMPPHANSNEENSEFQHRDNILAQSWEAI